MTFGRESFYFLEYNIKKALFTVSKNNVLTGYIMPKNHKYELLKYCTSIIAKSTLKVITIYDTDNNTNIVYYYNTKYRHI